MRSPLTGASPPPADSRILLIEPDPHEQAALEQHLRAAGFAVRCAGSGGEAITQLSAAHPDLVLIEPRLQDIDGMGLCRALGRLTAAPLVVLSADGREERLIALLDADAHDYIVKPYRAGELLARLRAQLRLARQRLPLALQPGLAVYGELRIDFARRQITRRGQPIHLRPFEWTLLRALARRAGQVVSFDELWQLLWPGNLDRGSDALYNRVSGLRLRLGAPGLIETVRGLGYRMRAEE